MALPDQPKQQDLLSIWLRGHAQSVVACMPDSALLQHHMPRLDCRLHRQVLDTQAAEDRQQVCSATTVPSYVPVGREG